MSHVTSATARVAGGVPAVDHDQAPPCPGRLVSDHAADLGEEKPALAVPEPGARVLRGLPAGAGLVPGVAGTPREEVAERDLLVADRLLERRCLQKAEDLTPDQTRTHWAAREVARELRQLSSPRPAPELRELAERFGA